MEHQEIPKSLQDSIASMQKMRDTVKNAAKEHPDVKSGKITVEDQLKEPGYILYDQIVNSVVDTLSTPNVASLFVKLGERLGEEFSQNFVSILALCMASSSHNAIVFYDELLKEELQSKFREISQHINICETDVQAFGKAMEVFKKRIDALDEDKRISDALKENGIDPDKIN